MQAWHVNTTQAAKGKWKGILLTLGVPAEVLVDRHGPCPMCGGKDRFRWDNKEGQGTFICNSCGAGDGMKLAIGVTGKPFAEVAKEIDAMLGNLKPDGDKPRADLSEAQRLSALREVAGQTVRIQRGDLVDKYLTTRGVGEHTYFKTLRFAPRLRDGEGQIRPCMVATVQDPAGVNVTLHRTFLKPDGSAKAEMASPRKLMPGPLPKGSAVRLSDYTGGPLGIAEGIETALSAIVLFEMPVWAAINAHMLANWTPPDGCTEVAIFGDNDPKFAGQASAYQLAHRLALAGIDVTVHIPRDAGRDWNDELMASYKKKDKAA